MNLICKLLFKFKRQSKSNLDYSKVLKYAKKKHKGQLRKDGKTPYIQHPIAAAEIIREFVNKYGREEDVELLPELIAAALLHDTIEDTYVCPKILEKRFGVLVAGLVQDVTTVNYDKNEKGKDRYLAEKMLAMSDYALILKLADRLANIRDSEQLTLEEKFKLRRGTENILKYVEDRRSSYFSELQIKLFETVWEDLNTYIPYKIFVGTKFEEAVFNNISYININPETWHEGFAYPHGAIWQENCQK